VADDLVISLSADTIGFVRDMQNAAGQMKGIGAAAQQTNSLLSRMNWGMAASGLAIGLQDAASVLSNNGSFGQALNAAGNNLIQVAAMAHPVAGAVSAIVIAGVQLAPLFSNAKEEARKLKEETEATKKAIEEAVGAAGRFADGLSFKPQQGVGTIEAQANRAAELDNEAAMLRQQQQERVDLLLLQQQQNVDLQNANVMEYRKKLQQEINDLRQKELEKEELAYEIRRRNAGQDFKTTEQLKEEAEARAAIGAKAKEQADARKKEQDEENTAMKINRDANAEQEKWRADMETRRREDAAMVRDALMPPEQRLGKEADRLSRLDLTDYEISTTLMKQAQGLFGGGPQLSAGLVKGTIEEESFRNRKEAEERNKQFIRAMVDRLIRELKPPEPAPEVVVGGGH
jgi:hypothetical protein